MERIWKERLSPNWGTIPGFAWRDYGKSGKSSVSIAGVPAQNSTEHPPTKSLELFLLSSTFDCIASVATISEGLKVAILILLSLGLKVSHKYALIQQLQFPGMRRHVVQ
jgi:hypothetical protein